MYLTKIPDIPGDDYQLHQKIRTFFPDPKDRVLFQRNDLGIFILSKNKPIKNTITTTDIDITTYMNGNKHPFTLRINTVEKSIKTKKRIAIQAKDIKSWLNKKLQNAGIEANFQYIPEGTHRSIRKNCTISFSSVLSFGVLTIIDQDLFRKTLINGLGRCKGFGFGLINVFS